MNKPALIFYHGFLGGPEDWLSVIRAFSHYDCICMDLNTRDPLKTAELHLRDRKPQPCFLIGYSMGGRIAWQLANAFPFIKGLIVLGAHPGLSNEEEKKQRYHSDQAWVDLLEKGDMSHFLDTWYTQPLFSTLLQHKDRFASLLQKRHKRDPEILAAMLRTMTLAHQPLLVAFAPMLFLHGIHDLKYGNLYSDQTLVEAIPDAGHAAHIENPQAVASAIQRFVESYS